MFVYLLILLIFVIMILTVYYPAIRQRFVLKRVENDFYKELSLLDGFYKDKLIIITERLGEGPSQNSDIRFSVAHENQTFAVASIMDLVSELGG